MFKEKLGKSDILTKCLIKMLTLLDVFIFLSCKVGRFSFLFLFFFAFYDITLVSVCQSTINAALLCLNWTISDRIGSSSLSDSFFLFFWNVKSFSVCIECNVYLDAAQSALIGMKYWVQWSLLVTALSLSLFLSIFTFFLLLGLVNFWTSPFFASSLLLLLSPHLLDRHSGAPYHPR